MDICTAIIEICKDKKADAPSVSVNAEDYSQITYHDGNPNNITVDQIKAKQAKLKTAYDNAKYQRDRAEAYPSIADQLDDLYHNGIDGWKATIKATKDKYPK
jgi:hypothetical protein